MKEQFKSLLAIVFPPDEMRPPVTGRAVPLQDVPDEIFAQNILGAGLAFHPHEGTVWAPVNGTIARVLSNGQVFWIEGKQGITSLLQIGLEPDDGQDPKVYTQIRKGERAKYGNELPRFAHDRTQTLSGDGLVIPVATSGFGKNKLISVAPDVVSGGRDEILRMSGSRKRPALPFLQGLLFTGEVFG